MATAIITATIAHFFSFFPEKFPDQKSDSGNDQKICYD